MAITNILLIVAALVLPTNARSLSMKATKAEDEQKTLFRRPLPPYLGHGIGRPGFGVGPGFGSGVGGGFGNNPFGGISSGSGLGFGAGTGFGSSIGGAGGFGSGVGFGFGDDGGSSSNGNGVFAGGQGEGDDAAIGNQKP
ncbi:uncharacterized protein LOC107810938 [Nicotiana tabacum]|uniref:Glycine-rich cell wall structural protein 1 n=2 Tax=Nicotiana TaxID=4085 RepID=A0A1S4BQU1_TOBAC|nr:PREDICTED: glycine-rich cell wall structural protein 1-like [Nicotiana sylvestris]XP_016491259.1 PREDICTED: glycine-rich cell wall structural protein 1-like [Nicotiana tabacum]